MSRTNPISSLPLFAEGSTAEAVGLSNANDVPVDASDSAPRQLYVEGSATSKAAADTIKAMRKSKREQVYLFILSQGYYGATRKEIAAALSMSENTVRPRVIELSEEKDPSFGCPRVFETGLAEDVRNGCSILYAGMFAKAAFDRSYAAKVPAA